MGSEKLKSTGGLFPGITGAGVGAVEDVTSNLVCCAVGAGDGEDAAEGEDLEESSGPGAVAEAAAESLLLRGSWPHARCHAGSFLETFSLESKFLLAAGSAAILNSRVARWDDPEMHKS